MKSETLILTLITVSISIMSIGIELTRGDDDLAVVETDEFSFTLPNPFSDKPILETNARPEGRFFLLHIPVIYNLEVLQRNGGFLDSKQSITFLGGLTDYYRNRKWDGQDNLIGPIRFSMLGLTLYDNNEPEV